MTSTNPVVSVLMIVYNEARWLPDAVTSLLGQTFNEWECIVVDDGSTDETPELLAALQDPRFRVFRHPHRQGRGAARKLALSEARGLYLGTLDGDDLYFPEKLALQVRDLDDNPNLTATVTGMFLGEQDGSPTGPALGYWKPGDYQLPNQIQHLRMPFAGALYRRDHVGQLSFDPELQRAEDQDFFTKLLRGREIRIRSDHLYVYRWSFEYGDVMRGLERGETLYLSRLSQEPLRSLLLFAYTKLKKLLYSAIALLGLWQWHKRFRYRRPTPAELEDYQSLLSSLQSNTPHWLTRTS